MKYFLGMDLGLVETGVTSIEEPVGTMEVISWKPKDLTGTPRLDYFDDSLCTTVDALGGPAAIGGVAIEGYSFGSKSQAHKIGELGGLIRWRLYKLGIRSVLVPPNTLKLYGTGLGTSPKGVMIREVFKRWDIEVSSDDQADSVALSNMARDIFLPRMPEYAYQLRALENVEMMPALPRPRTRPRAV